MKIGFVIEHLDPSRGGAETYVCDLAGQLATEGHEVHVFTQDVSGTLPEGVSAHEVAVAGVGKGFRMLSFDKQSATMAARFELDVVMAVGKTRYFNVLQPHGGTYMGTLRQDDASRHPSLFERVFAALSIKRGIFRLMERRQYRRKSPAVYVALSKMVRRDMMDYYGVPEEKIELVYNGVDTEKFSPGIREVCRGQIRKGLGLVDDDVLLLMIAHNPRLKGLEPLLYAFEMADQKLPDRFHLAVVGRKRPRYYKRLAKRLEIHKRVHFVGASDLPQQYYAAADAYVQPTYYDPCSLVVLEAWAMGLPVVTTRFNGASELMQPDVHGYILDHPEDVDALAEMLVKLGDAERRKTMGQAARELAGEHTIEKNRQEMMAVFAKAASLGGPS